MWFQQAQIKEVMTRHRLGKVEVVERELFAVGHYEASQSLVE